MTPLAWNRRTALGVFAGGVLALAGSPGRAAVAPPARRGWQYQVLVDDSPSGSCAVDFRARPDGFSVISAMAIDVELTLWGTYRFRQHCREDWTGGQLKRMDCVTDDDGAASRVTAWRDGAGYAIAGSGGRRLVPNDGIPPGFWTGAVLARRHLIDPSSGDLVPFAARKLAPSSVDIAGTVVRGRGYAFESFISGEIWFDSHQHLAAMTFGKSGSRIALVRTQEMEARP